MGCGVKRSSHFSPAKQDPSVYSHTLPKKFELFQNNVLYLFCFNSNNENILLKFDGINEEWESLAITQKNIIINEESQALQLDKDLILITGGKAKSFKSSDEFFGTTYCQLYVIKKNLFYPFPSLSIPRASHMLINDGDMVYCMGGHSENNDNEGITSSVEKINLNSYKNLLKEGIEHITNEGLSQLKWDEIESFHKPRYSALTFIFGDEIYLLGGMGRNKKIIKEIEKFNTLENQWKILEWKLPFSIYSAAATALNQNEILIIGGKNEAGLTPSIYQMDFQKKKYHSKGAFSFRINPKILHFEEDLYIFGGDKEMSCEKLNPIEFISYAASESYTNFINNDLSCFPAAESSLRIGDKLDQETEVILKVFEQDLKISGLNEKNYEFFYTFGTPNHPFILEFHCKNETVKFHPVSFMLKFYYYGNIIRINQYFGFTIGGIIPPHKRASKQSHLVDFRTMGCKKMAKGLIGRCKSFMIGNPDDNMIYVAGGISFEGNNEKHLINFERLDLMTNKWEKLNEMNYARFNANGFFSKKNLFVFGGSDGHNYLDSVEKYDISMNKWEMVNELKMPKALSNFTINLYNADSEEFLFIGGSNKENFSNEVLLLKMENYKYEKICEIKEPRSGHKVFYLENSLVILGGSRSEIGVEVLRLFPLEVSVNENQNFEESLDKYYRDKTLAGVQSC